MANWVEQDVRDIRKEIQDVAKDGCAHRVPMERSIDVLHQRIDGERAERMDMGKELGKKMDRIYYTSLVTAGGIIAFLAESLFRLLAGK